jgi:NADH:ubiquinone oxidoreductase subunit 3 (subunit A)
VNILPSTDYLTTFTSIGGDPFLGFFYFLMQFYGLMIIFIILNSILLLALTWSFLVICRLLGIPWVDGTTEGFINRK